MKIKFLKSFLIILISAASAYAQMTPAERQAQEISPEVKKIIAESSVLDRWVTKEQWRQIVKEIAAKPGPEQVIVVDTTDQKECANVFSQLRSEGWPADETLCGQDLTKPHLVLALGVKISDCIIETQPHMKIEKNKCPYITVKMRW